MKSRKIIIYTLCIFSVLIGKELPFILSLIMFDLWYDYWFAPLMATRKRAKVINNYYYAKAVAEAA